MPGVSTRADPHNPRKNRAVSEKSILLSESGYRATIEEDRHSPGSITLVVDGTPQSHVDVCRPNHLEFEYVRRIGHAIDLVAPERAPITAVHLGAGALTLPRYVAATRPGSRQQVVELERDLIAFVRAEVPLPRGAHIRIRIGDAREVLGSLPNGLHGCAHIVVTDVFSGAQIPAHVTSAEFYVIVRTILAPRGIVAVNVTDGAGLGFARGQAATLHTVFAHVALIVEKQTLTSRRFGNIVILGSHVPLPVGELAHRVARDLGRARVIHGADLIAFVAGAPTVTDATATGSPAPARSFFELSRNRTRT